jgi:hypothetical protein
MTMLGYIGAMLNIDEYTFPDTDGFDYCARFGFRARYIGNYLGRPLKATMFKTEGYNKIVMNGHHTPSTKCSIVPEKSLRAPVFFDQPRYDALGPEEHHEFFLGMYLEGIEKAHRDFPIPYDVLMQGIEDFRKSGYKNEWVHQRKLLRPFGLHASLLFDMDSKRFRARLQLERKGAVIYDQTVLEDHPDEICFAYKVKEIATKDDQILVMRQYGDVQFTLDVNTLG